jgi:hypothetical protein
MGLTALWLATVSYAFPIGIGYNCCRMRTLGEPANPSGTNSHFDDEPPFQPPIIHVRQRGPAVGQVITPTAGDEPFALPQSHQQTPPVELWRIRPP